MNLMFKKSIIIALLLISILSCSIGTFCYLKNKQNQSSRINQQPAQASEKTKINNENPTPSNTNKPHSPPHSPPKYSHSGNPVHIMPIFATPKALDKNYLKNDPLFKSEKSDLYCTNVAGDGNCFYHATVYQIYPYIVDETSQTAQLLYHVPNIPDPSTLMSTLNPLNPSNPENAADPFHPFYPKDMNIINRHLSNLEKLIDSTKKITKVKKNLRELTNDEINTIVKLLRIKLYFKRFLNPSEFSMMSKANYGAYDSGYVNLTHNILYEPNSYAELEFSVDIAEMLNCNVRTYMPGYNSLNSNLPDNQRSYDEPTKLSTICLRYILEGNHFKALTTTNF